MKPKETNYAPKMWSTELRGHARTGGAGHNPDWHTRLPARAAQSKSGAWAVAFGAVLRYYRLKADISQDVLARNAGVDRTYPSMIERGLRCPTIATFVALCDGMEVDPVNMLQRVIAEKEHPQLREPILAEVLEDR